MNFEEIIRYLAEQSVMGEYPKSLTIDYESYIKLKKDMGNYKIYTDLKKDQDEWEESINIYGPGGPVKILPNKKQYEFKKELDKLKNND